MLVLAFVLTQGWSVREAACRSVQPAGIPKESGIFGETEDPWLHADKCWFLLLYVCAVS